MFQKNNSKYGKATGLIVILVSILVFAHATDAIAGSRNSLTGVPRNSILEQQYKAGAYNAGGWSASQFTDVRPMLLNLGWDPLEVKAAIRYGDQVYVFLNNGAEETYRVQNDGSLQFESRFSDKQKGRFERKEGTRVSFETHQAWYFNHGAGEYFQAPYRKKFHDDVYENKDTTVFLHLDYDARSGILELKQSELRMGNVDDTVRIREFGLATRVSIKGLRHATAAMESHEIVTESSDETITKYKISALTAANSSSEPDVIVEVPVTIYRNKRYGPVGTFFEVGEKTVRKAPRGPKKLFKGFSPGQSCRAFFAG